MISIVFIKKFAEICSFFFFGIAQLQELLPSNGEMTCRFLATNGTFQLVMSKSPLCLHNHLSDICLAVFPSDKAIVM